MALSKSSQQALADVQNFLGLGDWSPKITSAQSLVDNNLSYIWDSTKKTTIVYYMVENTFDYTTTLYSQSFSWNKTVWKAASKPTKLITNIYASSDSDAKTKGFYDLEKSLQLDIDGDGLLGSSIVLVESGSKTLTSSDISLLLTDTNYYISLGLAANGRSGTKFNITSAINKPIIIGALSVDQETSLYSDALMSSYQFGFPGTFAGFGISKQGTFNIADSTLYYTGSLVSTYMISAINLSPEYADLVIGGIGAGFGARSNGTVNVSNSHLYLHRNLDSTDVTSSDYDVMHAWVAAGFGGATGAINFTNSVLEFKGTDNQVSIADESGGKGTLNVSGTQLLLDGQFSVNDDANSNDNLAASELVVGRGIKAVATAKIQNSSLVTMDGHYANCEVGTEGGSGLLTIAASRVEQIAKRSLEPISRDTNPFTIEQYANSWSGSYLTVGYDDGDDEASTNNITTGEVSIVNNSLYLIKGPHAGIEVGGSGTKSKGTLTIDHSFVEVIGAGAIHNPDAITYTTDDYLAAGVNDNGEWNTDYFSFVNIGGSSWKDFGGTGTLNIQNASSLTVGRFDITSDDTLLDVANSYLSVGGWGTRAALNVDGNSTVRVMGQIGLGIGMDMSPTSFNTSNGLYNVSNYSLVNVKNGSVLAYGYDSLRADQGIYSPLNKYAMYTVLGSQGSITANIFNFYDKSKILGSGTLNVADVFTGQPLEIHDDINTLTSYELNGHDAHVSDGFLSMRNTDLYVGDTLNFEKLTQTSGYGTLTMRSQVDSSHQATLNINSSKLYFDLSKTASDQLLIKDFDICTFTDDTFVIKGSGLKSGQAYTLIDFQGDATIDLDISVLNQKIELIGVKGLLSYDSVDTDLIFTVG